MIHTLAEKLEFGPGDGLNWQPQHDFKVIIWGNSKVMSGNSPVVLATNRMRFLCVCVSDNIISEQDTPKHVNVVPSLKKNTRTWI